MLHKYLKGFDLRFLVIFNHVLMNGGKNASN